MKIEKSDARRMKFYALRWLRLEQRCMFIATEAGSFNSDALGINEEKMIEIEVKVTMQDFKNDFNKWKHNRYSGYFSESVDQWVPNYFYFAMPDELIEDAKLFLKARAEKENKVGCYGVIQMSDWKIVKRAKKLHERKPTNTVKSSIALRMGSELIRFHEAWL